MQWLMKQHTAMESPFVVPAWYMLFVVAVCLYTYFVSGAVNDVECGADRIHNTDASATTRAVDKFSRRFSALAKRARESKGRGKRQFVISALWFAHVS
jgi:hypothetical protein